MKAKKSAAALRAHRTRARNLLATTVGPAKRAVIEAKIRSFTAAIANANR